MSVISNPTNKDSYCKPEIRRRTTVAYYVPGYLKGTLDSMLCFNVSSLLYQKGQGKGT